MTKPRDSHLSNHAHGADLETQIDARGAIEQKRQAVGKTREAPDNQAREQAAILGETFANASHQALQGFERAEARLTALERELQGRMAQMSRDLQAVVAELRTARPAAAPGGMAAFPLESVMRIHEELRESDTTAVPGSDALKAGLASFSRAESAPAPQLSESTSALTARLASLERVVGTSATEAGPRISGSRPHYSIIGLIVAVVGVILFSLWTQRRVEARLNDAAARVAAAERQRDAATELTDARLAATREEAARQVADARQSAIQAQVVGNVLAAPDLVRYWLVGKKATPRPYGQVLFSRSRGMVFSASRLPAAGTGKTYQLWLLSKGGPVSAGLMTPDDAGRVTLATDVPPKVAKRLTGTALTLEPAGGRPKPSGTTVLVRAR